MANRSVVVRLSAQVGEYISGFGKAKQATDELGRSQDKTSSTTDKTTQSTQKSSAVLVEQAAKAQASAAALGLSYNAAGQLTDANGKLLTSAQASAHGLDQFSKAVYLTADSSTEAKTGLDRLTESAETNRDAWDKTGAALTAFGVGAVAALAAVSKAAMDWESAWAGVTKTVDGSPEQMAELETGLRGLAKTLPVTHKEIAGVAEAAGQLGVAREDILGFTKTMIDLGVSTNLTSEDAATNIAQISNVMGTMSREGALGVARFGSALVALGNDGASTESEILALAQRISGAAATVGATEVEVLALSNTLASMGVKAELGGGVTTRVLLKMYSAVESGGAALDAFAKTAGVSAADFAKAFRESPVEAMDMVAQGMARVKEEGGNVVQAMDDMGIKGTQEMQVMLSLAASGDLLTDSLKLGTQAWNENVALVNEATKRYDTAESRVRIAWNNIKDAAISAGAVMLPVISGLADGISNLASFFGSLPAPIQGVLTILGGLTGVAALTAGAFLMLFPRVMDTVKAFQTLGVTGAGAAGKLKGLGKALGIAGIALAAAAALKAYHNSMQPAVASTEEMTQALIGIKNNKNAINDVFANIDPGSGGAVLKDVNDIGDALDRLQNGGFTDWIGKVSAGWGVNNDFAKMGEAVANVDTALAGMAASGNLETAQKGFKSVADSAKEQGLSLEDLEGKFPSYMDSLRQLASAQEVQLTDQELLNWAMGETPQKMLDAAAASKEAAAAQEEQAAASEEAAAAAQEFIDAMEEIGLATDGTIISLEKFTEALFAAGLATMSSREAAFGWEETLRGVDEQIQGVVDGQLELGSAINSTGTDFDKLTESGKSANEVFQGIVQEGLAVANTFGGDLSKSAADVNQQLQATYAAGVKTAEGLGLSEEAAIALTREVMGIPPGVAIETWMSDEALRMSGNTKDTAESIPDHVSITTSMDEAAFKTAGKTKKAAEDIPNKETIDSWMSDAAFVEAIRTRAAAEGIPPDVAIASFMESAARNEADSTTAQVLKIPKGTSISSYMDAYARAEAEALERKLNSIDGKTVNTYTNHHTNYIENQMPGRGGSAPRAAGGARLTEFFGLNGLAGGGRVPGQRSPNHTKDNTLAWAAGEAIALEGTEWVINPRSSDVYNEELAAINSGAFPKGVLSGGLAVGAGREYQAPTATAAVHGAVTEKHFHTHVSSAPGMEQSYAQTIADKATQRQRDVQLAYSID